MTSAPVPDAGILRGPRDTTIGNLGANLERTAANHPAAIALRVGADAITYAQLDARTARAAGWLRSVGIGPGDRVLLSMPNIPAFAVVYYAVLRLGAIVVPMNPLLKHREVLHYIDGSQASLAIGITPDVASAAQAAGIPYVAAPDLGARIDAAAAEPVAHAVPRTDDDTAVILYTSGTTGHPKGAELTHANLQTNQEMCQRELLELEPGDVMLGCLPFFHVFGMTVALNTSVAHAGTLVLVTGFNPREILDVIENDNVRIFVGVPTMYGALLAGADARAKAGRAPADVSSLQLCISGGAALPVEVLHAFERRFGTTLLEGYGLSEASPVVSFNHFHLERMPGSIGTPLPGITMALQREDGSLVPDGDVESVGELVVRGPGVMKGYWCDPDATAEVLRGDWLHTGDLARRDELGRYFIVDRKKDVIIRGGFNVYPREVEEVLYEHPAVAEAAVIGIPHPHLGEEVAAYVTLKADASATPEEIRDFVHARVANYKFPREVRVIDALPKGGTGKILKRELPR